MFSVRSAPFAFLGFVFPWFSSAMISIMLQSVKRPLDYAGPCVGRKSFTAASVAQKQSWGVHCRVNCGSSLECFVTFCNVSQAEFAVWLCTDRDRTPTPAQNFN